MVLDPPRFKIITKTASLKVLSELRSEAGEAERARASPTLKANKYFTCVQTRKVAIGHWET
jgi:hypothetical protein